MAGHRSAPARRRPPEAGADGWLRCLADPARRAAIAGLLRAADTGVHDVIVERHPAVAGGSRVRFRHGGPGGVLLDAEEESAGTLRLLGLAVRAVPVLHGGGLLLADEIDASLHPLLTAALVGTFRSRQARGHGAQLLFAARDAALLGSPGGEDALRRDEAWFTSKGRDGASVLLPPAGLRHRPGEDRQARYLAGRYGAIPELPAGPLTARGTAPPCGPGAGQGPPAGKRRAVTRPRSPGRR